MQIKTRYFETENTHHCGHPQTRGRELSQKNSPLLESSAQCTFHFDSRRLEVRGFIVDTIKDIEERWKDLIPTFSAIGVTRYGRRLSSLPPSPEDVSHSTSFWASRLNHMHSLEDALESPVADDGRDNTPCLDMRVFRTEADDYVGMTDVAIRKGDVICALFGGNVPYILRRGEEFWVLVGQW